MQTKQERGKVSSYNMSAEELMLSNCAREDFLRVHHTKRRSNHSLLKEISPEYSSEGLMLKLKLHYFGHLMWRADSLEMTLMLGRIEGRRRRGWQRMRWPDNITDWMGMNLSKLAGEIHGLYSPWVTKSQTRLSDFHFHFWLHHHIPTRMTKFKTVTISTELNRL